MSVHIVFFMKALYSFLLVMTIVLTGCSADNTYFLSDINTGWADYVDTTYVNSSAAFTVTGGTGYVSFPNNAGEIRDSQIPAYINATGGYYNGTHILGRNGDMYGIGMRVMTRPSGPNTWCEFRLDIGGSVGQLPFRFITFPKGALSHSYNWFSDEYTLDTWELNGAVVQVQCNNDVDFWDISYKLNTVHKAR